MSDWKLLTPQQKAAEVVAKRKKAAHRKARREYENSPEVKKKRTKYMMNYQKTSEHWKEYKREYNQRPYVRETYRRNQALFREKLEHHYKRDLSPGEREEVRLLQRGRLIQYRTERYYQAAKAINQETP